MQVSARRAWVIGGVVAAVLIFAVGAYALHRAKSSSTSAGNGATSTAASLATSSSYSLHVSGSGSYTVKQLPDRYVPAGPDYRTALVFSSSVSPDVRAALNAQFSTIKKMLSANFLDFNAWIDLGTIRKIGEDYAGAAADWEYVSKLYPTNIVSAANLADLYTNFLHDYPKAAAAYLQQIKNSPHDIAAYADLFSLYTHQYPAGSVAPENILQQGIAANPNATDLKQMLDSYLASKH